MSTLNGAFFEHPTEEPLAIEPSALSRQWVLSPRGERLYELGDDGVAIVSITGPLTRQASRYGYFDGYDGEVGVVARVRAAQSDPRVHACVQVIASPGGLVAGLFDAVETLSTDKTKPVVAWCDEAYSAAYALACTADKIVVSRNGGVGSIGVIVDMISRAKQLEADGIDVEVISSGVQKTDGHPAVPISEAAKARVRARVSALAEQFAGVVAAARGLTTKDVLALQAGCLYGEDAVKAGLADQTGTLAQAIDLARTLAAVAAKGKEMKQIAKALGLAETATEAEIASCAQQLADLTSALYSVTEEKGVAALEKVKAFKREASEAKTLREQFAALTKAEQERYVNALLEQRGEKDSAPMRRLFLGQAAVNFEAFKSEFPLEPGTAQVVSAVAEGNKLRFASLPRDNNPTPRDTAAEASAAVSREEMEALGLTDEDVKKYGKAKR